MGAVDDPLPLALDVFILLAGKGGNTRTPPRTPVFLEVGTLVLAGDLVAAGTEGKERTERGFTTVDFGFTPEGFNTRVDFAGVLSAGDE